MEEMTPQELKRRGAPLLPIMRDHLAFMEERGVLVVVNQSLAEVLLVSIALAVKDTYKEPTP